MTSPVEATKLLSKELLSLLHEGNSAADPGVYYVPTRGPHTLGDPLLKPDVNLLIKAAQAEAPDPTLPLEQVNAATSKDIYFPLLPATVRTILLHPGGPKDPIVCSLVQPTVIKYQVAALSYVWGSHENPAYILLNERVFYITRNLEAALLRVRGEETFQELWIDALCINQFDQAERNEQVRRMHQVYAQVSDVLAWLGPTNNLVEAATIVISSVENMEQLGETPSSLVDPFHKFLDELNLDELKEVTCSLTHLYRNEYWDRVWIVQELALAKRVTVICGEYEPVTLAALMDLGAALDSRKLQMTSSFSEESYNFILLLSGLPISGPNTVTIAPIPGMAWTNTPTNNLLHLIRVKHCKDPRDKIFGCFNLLEPALQEKISVDYSRGSREVVLSALQTVIVTTQRLDVITWQKPRNDQSSPVNFESSFPHWAPSLNLGRKDVRCELAGNFDAGRESRGTISFSPGSEILRTKGVKLGYVHDTFRPSADYDPSAPNVPWEVDYGMHLLPVLGYIRRCIEHVELDYGGPIDRAKLVHTITQGQFDEPQWSNLIVGLSTLPTEDANKHVAALSPQVLFALEASSRLLFPRVFFLMIPTDASTHDEQEGSMKPDMGLGTYDIQAKDIICILLGCKVPVMLRSEGEHYRVICDTYIHGCMYGEGLKAFEDGEEELEEFLLC